MIKVVVLARRDDTDESKFLFWDHLLLRCDNDPKNIVKCITDELEKFLEYEVEIGEYDEYPGFSDESRRFLFGFEFNEKLSFGENVELAKKFYLANPKLFLEEIENTWKKNTRTFADLIYTLSYDNSINLDALRTTEKIIYQANCGNVGYKPDEKFL